MVITRPNAPAAALFGVSTAMLAGLAAQALSNARTAPTDRQPDYAARFAALYH